MNYSSEVRAGNPAVNDTGNFKLCVNRSYNEYHISMKVRSGRKALIKACSA